MPSRAHYAVHLFAKRLLASWLLLFAAFFGAFSSSNAQSILISSPSGSGVTDMATNMARTYNFGITTLGAGQLLAFTNIGVYMNRASGTTQPFTVSIYGGLGGTGPVLTNFTIAATNVNQGTTALFNLLLTNTITLSNGNYSIRMTSTEANTANTAYGIRKGTLQLMESNGSTTLPTDYWVADTNSDGTAGTNFQAPFVLADYQLTTTDVDFGNYRVGSALATNVALTNTAPPGVNSTNGNVTEQLSTLATVTNAATVSGLSTNLLARAATTNFTVGLATGNVGTNSGLVTLSYKSLTNGTASARTNGATNIGSESITVTGVGYRLADDAVSTTNVNLGRFHIGYTTNNGSLSSTVGITNTSTNDGYSEGLAVANNGTSGGATVSGIPGGLVTAGANTNVTVGLGSVTSVGTNSGSVTFGFQSSGVGTSGLAATNVGSQVVNVIAQGYSGQGVWSTSAGGSWNNFDNWDAPGGTPGIDGVLSTNDTATFGNAISTSRTVSLNGQSPVLTTMTFSNAAASYTIAQGSGGSITMGTPSAGQTVITNAAGNHTVSAAISLARATQVGVATNSKLSVSSVNGSQNLNKSGSGTLSITGTGNLSGSTTVTGGTLNVNGSISNSTVTMSTGTVLSGSGTVGETTIANGATISPGNSPGTLNINGDLNLSSGGNYDWQIYNAAGPAGTGWDLITISGVLDLSTLSAENKFNINMWSLASLGPDVNGNAINFVNTQSYTWTIATAAMGITNFSATYFNLYESPNNGTGGFSNDKGTGGLFTLETQGNNLNIVFTPGSGPGPSPVPEPGTWAAAALLAGTAGYIRWRRRGKFSR